jgi:DNA modification methylase
MMTWHKIIIGDSRCMKEVPDESVHLIITSPLTGSSRITETGNKWASMIHMKITLTTSIWSGMNAIGFCIKGAACASILGTSSLAQFTTEDTK